MFKLDLENAEEAEIKLQTSIGLSEKQENFGKNIFFWSRCVISARISRALRNAVSPEVIGQTTTPMTARIPPTLFSIVREISSTTEDGPALESVVLIIGPNSV